MLPKIVYWAKFEGKLFSDAKCPGPLLQRSPLNFYIFLKRKKKKDPEKKLLLILPFIFFSEGTVTTLLSELPSTSLPSLPFFINVEHFSSWAIFLSKEVDQKRKPIIN